MAIASPARPSIAISANPGDETVQTQQNTEVDREATGTSPEVRQSEDWSAEDWRRVLWSKESSLHGMMGHYVRTCFLVG